MRLGGDVVRRLRDVRLRHGGGFGADGVVGVRCPRRIVGAHPRQFEAVQHVGGLVLDRLERGDRTVELHADLGVLDCERRSRPPSSRSTPRTGRRWRRPRCVATRASDHRRVRPARLRGPSNSRRASLRVTSHAGTTSPPGASTRNVPMPCSVRATTKRPVRGVAVDDDRLLSGQPPAAALAHRTSSHAGHRIAGAGLFERDRAARRAGRERCRVGRRARGACAASVANTADEKYGPGNGTRPISSITTTMSTRPRPRPPFASGTSNAGQPRVDDAIPHLVGEASLVVFHRAARTPAGSRVRGTRGRCAAAPPGLR